MTAAEGGPALEDADAAAPASADGGPGATARTWAPRQRTVLGLARVEASLLVRSLLVLAGLVVGGLVIWILIQSVEPLWWNAAWRIGFGQLVLGMAVLVAAQLAAGRPSRDGLADLYASFPATAATRTLAHLAGLAGAVPASLLLVGAATAVVQVRGAIGAPGVVVLAGGLLLVIAAGAAGTAIGSRFPHPLAGVLGADAHFDLALTAAEWAVRIPPQATGSPSGQVFLACVPFDQAREAVAIWLAILATHPSASGLRDGLGTGRGFTGTEVRNTFVQTWNYPGVGFGYVTPPGGGPQDTAAGYLLANAMTRLPEQQVAHILTDAWGRWLNWRTTDAQLAAALGIPMPSVHTSVPLPPRETVAPGPGNAPPRPPACRLSAGSPAHRVVRGHRRRHILRRPVPLRRPRRGHRRTRQPRSHHARLVRTLYQQIHGRTARHPARRDHRLVRRRISRTGPDLCGDAGPVAPLLTQPSAAVPS